ncbi:YdcF family protein [Herbaspirillum robiniae]|uniref:YdcF family protein n=1 Tax=Herbaspirillum robiniae TaxID=2014887 RepID=UPI003D774215
MNASVLISTLAGAMLLPPLNCLLLCAIGLLLRPRLRRTGTLLMVLGVALLLLLSTRAGALLLVRPLENRYAPLTEVKDAQAIVILGAGRQANAPEYGGADAASLNGLKRLEYGAYLHKRTGLPLLVTGGSPDGSPESEASLMARVLSADFGVQARWQEGASNNTQDNAVMSAAMLKTAGVERVLLVTDAIHMPRAMNAFAAAGLQATAAPTLFSGSGRPLPTDYFPHASNLAMASYAMHEWIGQLWYRLRYHGAGSRSD